MFAAQRPWSAGPVPTLQRVVPANRQCEAGNHVQAAFQQNRQATTFFLILQVVLERIDIDRQGAFLPEVVIHIFVAGDNMRGVYSEPSSQRRCKALRMFGTITLWSLIVSNPARIMPEWLIVAAPVAGQCPAR